MVKSQTNTKKVAASPAPRAVLGLVRSPQHTQRVSSTYNTSMRKKKAGLKKARSLPIYNDITDTWTLLGRAANAALSPPRGLCRGSPSPPKPQPTPPPAAAASSAAAVRTPVLVEVELDPYVRRVENILPSQPEADGIVGPEGGLVQEDVGEDIISELLTCDEASFLNDVLSCSATHACQESEKSHEAESMLVDWCQQQPDALPDVEESDQHDCLPLLPPTPSLTHEVQQHYVVDVDGPLSTPRGINTRDASSFSAAPSPDANDDDARTLTLSQLLQQDFITGSARRKVSVGKRNLWAACRVLAERYLRCYPAVQRAFKKPTGKDRLTAPLCLEILFAKEDLAPLEQYLQYEEFFWIIVRVLVYLLSGNQHVLSHEEVKQAITKGDGVAENVHYHLDETILGAAAKGAKYPLNKDVMLEVLRPVTHDGTGLHIPDLMTLPPGLFTPPSA